MNLFKAHVNFSFHQHALILLIHFFSAEQKVACLSTSIYSTQVSLKSDILFILTFNIVFAYPGMGAINSRNPRNRMIASIISILGLNIYVWVFALITTRLKIYSNHYLHFLVLFSPNITALAVIPTVHPFAANLTVEH